MSQNYLYFRYAQTTSILSSKFVFQEIKNTHTFIKCYKKLAVYQLKTIGFWKIKKSKVDFFQSLYGLKFIHR